MLELSEEDCILNNYWSSSTECYSTWRHFCYWNYIYSLPDYIYSFRSSGKNFEPLSSKKRQVSYFKQ